MKLSVIMPVYNEESTIGEILEKVLDVEIEKEIIVVDDGSSDRTGEILEEIKRNGADIRVFHHSRNMGKGAAIRTALREVHNELVIIQDGDLEYDPGQYRKLIKPVLDGQAEVVYGSRTLGRRFHPASFQNFIFFAGGRFLTMIANMLYGARLTDEPTCYKVFRTDVLKGMSLECRGFEFCPEVTSKLLRRGIRIVEVPILSHPRTIKEGKKIRLSDWFVAVYTLLKNRL